MLIATHATRYPELDYPSLQADFPNMLIGNYPVENSDGTGIPAVIDAVFEAAADLPLMGQQLSRRWIDARDEILHQATSSPQITFDEFSAVCRKHNVVDDEIDALASLLHELGQVVHYGDDDGLRDVVVLDPEWLTKAISYVLNDTTTRDDHGVLDHERLRKIWGEPAQGTAYPRKYHRYLLRLMEKFEVSYRLEDDEQRSLVAQLVPYQRHELPWEHDSPVPDGIRRLSLICELSDEAPGLISWLTVRWHDDSTDRHWRTGVFLRHHKADYQSEALFDLRGNRFLLLTVRAPCPDLYFNALRDGLEHLIARRWPGLTHQLLIPCAIRSPDGTGCTGRFKLDSLLKFRAKGKAVVDCLECTEESEIAELLTGFPTQAGPIEEQLRNMAGKLDDISSRSKIIEHYTADTAHTTRQILKAISTEITDCPRLFTLTPENPGKWSPRSLFQTRYHLTLWCEYPDQWHIHPDAHYLVSQAKDWLIQITPYAKLIIKTLKAVYPISINLTESALTEEQFKDVKHKLELMKTLVEKLPEPDDTPSWTRSRTELLEGSALRGFRQLLLSHDPVRAFGGLRRDILPSGEYIWVCPHHAKYLDPGLPTLPE